MQRLVKNMKEKWTRSSSVVHFNRRLNGQDGEAQVGDFIGKDVCPSVENLGVKLEGTLPGKQQ